MVWDAGTRTAVEYHLVDPAGQGSVLIPDMAETDVADLIRLDRKSVDLGGFSIVPDSPRNNAVRAREVRPSLASGGVLEGAAYGEDASFNFVTVLCRFPDDPAPVFARSQVEAAHGSSYPGVRNFFAELSWNPAIMQGSTVTDWYTLPHPREEYVSTASTDFGALARDCTRAADEDVHFPDFFGINLQFSSGLSLRDAAPYDTLSFGGSWTLTVNGVSRTYGMTWLSGVHALNYVVLAHEIGHALGWPHSSGEYHSEYDSDWDVMSRGYLRYEQPHGWLGVHTISHHKDEAGWVPDERRWIPEWGATERKLLVRTALPPEHGYLFARVSSAPNSFYTAETRRHAGHDQPLPGEAVVLHRVLNERAFVVDVDHNGDPNDAGAQWTPGEEFQDSIAGFSLRVDSASAAGFYVSITRGWRLDVSVAGAGRVVINSGPLRLDCGTACSTVATERGADILMAPAPAEGTVFSHWEGDCTGADLTCALDLKGNRSVRAVFRPIFAIDARPLGEAVMGAEYRDSLTLSGASETVIWSVTEGSLPPGVTLDADAGTIRGIATKLGTYRLTLAARHGELYLQHNAVVNVVAPLLTVEGVMDQLLTGEGLNAAEIRFMDLYGNRNGSLDVGDVRRWMTGDSQAGRTVLPGPGGR